MDRNIGERYNDETTDRPVYCNKKYNDRKTVIQSHTIDNFPTSYRSCKKEFAERNTKVDLFGDYAETDLDQPTDYSLRYAEDDTDDDEIQSPEYFKDTVKTYCTEGTPYETPFNFSTATSMSDLLLEDAKEPVVSQKKLNKKDLPLSHKGELTYDHTISHNPDENNVVLAKKELKNSKSSESCESSCLLPEKLLNYYQAGTSNGFSHTTTLTSLETAISQRSNVVGTISKETSTDSTIKADNVSERTDRNIGSSANVLHIPEEGDSLTDGKGSSRVVDKEGKVVTFSRQDYYAEQTPLMFSRCSSLGSLSGFEQHSIHDDRSSIVSDFSRRTSGIVSPSELPDSPTQTIPPSPRNHKNQCTDFIGKISEEAVRPSIRHLSYSKCNPTRASVFEDDIATFKEESTPIEFSTATSLSSLTIDDEMKIPNAASIQSELKEISNELENIKVDSPEEKRSNPDVEKEQEQVSDGDEDDEDMLAACISMGIQNNRYRQSFKTSTTEKPIRPESSSILVRCQRTPALNRRGPPVPVTSVETPPAATKTTKTRIEVAAASDTVHVYCTEDTPADISPVGSQSNLSALSMPSVPEDVERIDEVKSAAVVECHRNDLSDESSNLSGEDEKILDECIQSGIPKLRQITPPPTNCIPFTQKAEILSQRFNVYGTPSSSPVDSGNKNPVLRKPLCRSSLEHENDLSDDSPNHSDDEAILSECIRSAMPKVRLNISSMVGQNLSLGIEKSKVLATKKTSLALYHPPEYPEQSTQQLNKVPPFEDNLSLSEEEEDIMLAQCIKSGIPKALNVSSNTSASALKKPEQYSKSRNNASNSHYAYKVDSTRNGVIQVQSAPKPLVIHPPMQSVPPYAVHLLKSQENRRHSIKTSGLHSSEKAYSIAPNIRKYTQLEHDNSNTNENILAASRSDVTNCRSPIFNGVDNDDDEVCKNLLKSNMVPSRHSSISSLSEEGSLGSIEEWALLELCINSGMPRNKYRLKGVKNTEANTHEDRDIIAEDNYSLCSYNSNVCKT